MNTDSNAKKTFEVDPINPLGVLAGIQKPLSRVIDSSFSQFFMSGIRTPSVKPFQNFSPFLALHIFNDDIHIVPVYEQISIGGSSRTFKTQREIEGCFESFDFEEKSVIFFL